MPACKELESSPSAEHLTEIADRTQGEALERLLASQSLAPHTFSTACDKKAYRVLLKPVRVEGRMDQ